MSGHFTAATNDVFDERFRDPALLVGRQQGPAVVRARASAKRLAAHHHTAPAGEHASQPGQILKPVELTITTVEPVTMRQPTGS